MPQMLCCAFTKAQTKPDASQRYSLTQTSCPCDRRIPTDTTTSGTQDVPLVSFQTAKKFHRLLRFL